MKLIFSTFATVMLLLGSVHTTQAEPTFAIWWEITPDGLVIQDLHSGDVRYMYKTPRQCGESGQPYSTVEAALKAAGNSTEQPVYMEMRYICDNKDASLYFITRHDEIVHTTYTLDPAG